MASIFYIYGNEQTDHLRADIRESNTIFVSKRGKREEVQLILPNSAISQITVSLLAEQVEQVKAQRAVSEPTPAPANPSSDYEPDPVKRAIQAENKLPTPPNATPVCGMEGDLFAGNAPVVCELPQGHITRHQGTHPIRGLVQW